MEISKVKVKIKLKSFPILFDEILSNLTNNSNYAHINFTRIGTGSEAEVFKLPSGNVLRVSQDPCSKYLHKFFSTHRCICYPQVFNFKAIRNKFNQDLYISEMEPLVRLSKEEKVYIKPIEDYFKNTWTDKRTVETPIFKDSSLRELFNSCFTIYSYFKDTKYRNDMFTRNFMKRPKTNTFVIVDPICLKSFIRV